MSKTDKEKSPSESEDKNSDSKNDEQKKKDESSGKKPWKLAPRTGQRHANPFQRKTD